MLRVASIATAKARSVAARRVLELAPDSGEGACTITVRAPLPLDLEQARAMQSSDLSAVLSGSHALYEAGLLEGVPLDGKALLGLSSILFAGHLVAQCTLEHDPVEINGELLVLDPANRDRFGSALVKLMSVMPAAAAVLCAWALEPHSVEVTEGNGLPPASSPPGEPVQAVPSSPSRPSTGTTA